VFRRVSSQPHNQMYSMTGPSARAYRWSPRRKRPTVALAIPALMALLLAACGSAPASSKALIPVSLQLDFIKNVQFAGPLWGLEKGFYRDEGIALTISQQGPTTDPVQLVAAGAQTIGMESGDILIKARAKGIPVKAFAADLQISPVGWSVLESSGITRPADLKGRTIGMSPAYLQQAPLVLALEGLSTKDVTLKQVGFDESVLINHEVDARDAFSVNTPITLNMKGIANRFFPWHDSGYDYYTDVFFVTDSTLKEKASILQAFVRATQRAWADVFAHQSEVVDLIVTKYGQGLLNKQQQAGELAALKPLMYTSDTNANGFGSMTAAQWQTGIDQFAKFNLISSKFSESDIYAPGFVKK